MADYSKSWEDKMFTALGLPFEDFGAIGFQSANPVDAAAFFVF